MFVEFYAFLSRESQIEGLFSVVVVNVLKHLRALRGAAPLKVGLASAFQLKHIRRHGNRPHHFRSRCNGRKALYSWHAGDSGNRVGLLASGHTSEDVLKMYPYLEAEDIRAALQFAAWRSEEIEVPLESACL